VEPFLQGAVAGRGTVTGLMPTYDYACAHCGTFAELRRIADRDRAAYCPKCRDPATRVVAASPHVGGMGSLHERETGDGRYARMRHARGCGCCV
jgi:putative FmdB family regulatory protein